MNLGNNPEMSYDSYPLFTMFITKVSWETLDNKFCKEEEKNEIMDSPY